MLTPTDSIQTAYGQARFPVSALVLDAHRAWVHRVISPGSWWSGNQRIEFVAAVWAALDDVEPLPAWVAPSAAGRVPAGRDLPAPAHDIASRLARHAATCTEAWYAVPDARGVQVVNGMAVERPPLPDALPGDPDRLAPELVPATLNWVPVRPPADQRASVVQALHAVPDDFDMVWTMAAAQYMPDHEMVNMDWQRGILHRRQMELVAARVSLLRECFF